MSCQNNNQQDKHIQEKNNLYKFNLMMSYTVSFLIVSLLTVAVINFSNIKNEINFNFPYKSIYINENLSDKYNNLLKLSLSQLKPEDYKKLKIALKNNNIKLIEYYMSKSLTNKLLNLSSPQELIFFLKNYADPYKIKYLYKKINKFYKDTGRYDLNSYILEYDKIFGDIIKNEAIKNINVYKYTSSMYKGIINRARIISFIHNVFDNIPKNHSNFFNIYITFNSDLKIIDFKYEPNTLLDRIKKDIKFFYALNKTNIKNMFNPIILNNIEVQKFLLKDIKSLELVNTEIKDNSLYGLIKINNKDLYRIKIKNQSIVDIKKLN